MSLVEDNSLIVPVPVAWMMKHYPGSIHSDKEPDHELGRVIVMPGEVAVPQEHTPAVERWLKDHGIILPIPKRWDIRKKMMPRKRCRMMDCSLCSKSE